MLIGNTKTCLILEGFMICFVLFCDFSVIFLVFMRQMGPNDVH